MNSKRLFLAIKLPKQVKYSFSQFRIQNAHFDTLSPRWTRDENFHITLLFLGNVYSHHIAPLIKTIENILSEEHAFSLFFEKFLIRFPRDPRMIWGKFRDSAAFSQLSLKAFSQLRKFMSERFPAKHQIPHVTMARLGEITGELNIRNSPISSPKILVREVELWESQRFPTGPKYTSLAKFQLQE
jgi:2'-5' RNA ligase